MNLNRACENVSCGTVPDLVESEKTFLKSAQQTFPYRADIG